MCASSIQEDKYSRSSDSLLTHLSRLDFPTFISRTSPFPILGMLGGMVHFYSNLNKTLFKQTMHAMWRLICFCEVCLRVMALHCTLCLPSIRACSLSFTANCNKNKMIIFYDYHPVDNPAIILKYPVVMKTALPTSDDTVSECN